MTAGSYCTYAVRFDGSVASVGEGSYGRLGHTQSDIARLLRNIESLQGIKCVCMRYIPSSRRTDLAKINYMVNQDPSKSVLLVY